MNNLQRTFLSLQSESKEAEATEHIVEEYLEEESTSFVKTEKEFVDADALTCDHCNKILNTSSLDHHVCDRIKLEEVEEEIEDESSIEQDILDNFTGRKKKYPKKKLKDPITCPKCKRQFYYKAYFQFHYKDVHRNDREEICQFCGKVFKNSRRLNSHILIHQTDSEKKHKCDKCSKQFNFSGDLTRHKRVSW